MKEISEIKAQTIESRKKLQEFQKNLGENLIISNLYRIKKERMQKIQDIFQKIGLKFGEEIIQQINKKIRKKKYSSALQLIRESQENIYLHFYKLVPKTSNQKVIFLEKIIKKYKSLENIVWKILKHSLEKLDVSQY